MWPLYLQINSHIGTYATVIGFFPLKDFHAVRPAQAAVVHASPGITTHMVMLGANICWPGRSTVEHIPSTVVSFCQTGLILRDVGVLVNKRIHKDHELQSFCELLGKMCYYRMCCSKSL